MPLLLLFSPKSWTFIHPVSNDFRPQAEADGVPWFTTATAAVRPTDPLVPKARTGARVCERDDNHCYPIARLFSRNGHGTNIGSSTLWLFSAAAERRQGGGICCTLRCAPCPEGEFRLLLYTFHLAVGAWCCLSVLVQVEGSGIQSVMTHRRVWCCTKESGKSEGCCARLLCCCCICGGTYRYYRIPAPTS